MDKSNNFFKQNSVVISRFIIVAALFIFICIARPGFGSESHVKVLLVEASVIGIAAIGQTFVVITGGIDMSVPWTLNAAAMLTYSLSNADGSNLPVIIAMVIGLGALIGLINGLAVSYLQVPSIVMTLGVNATMSGIVTGLTGGTISGNTPSAINNLAMGTIGSVSNALIFWMILTVIVMIVLRKTMYGRKLYSLGNSRRVAYFSGVKVQLVECMAYVVAGVTAAIAGVLLLGKTGSAYLGMGNDYQFKTIAAVALGGVAMSGGSGSYVGTIAGSLTIAVLLSLLMALNFSTAVQQILYGLVLLVAIVFASIQTRGTRRKA